MNLFFVRNDILGTPMAHSWSDLVPEYSHWDTFKPIHGYCYNTLWQHVPADAAFQSIDLMEQLPPVLLSHSNDNNPPKDIRRFYEIALPVALRIRPGCRADLMTILHASEGAKQWHGTTGPRPETEQHSANGYLACPNGVHMDGHSRSSHGRSSTGQGHKGHEHGR